MRLATHRDPNSLTSDPFRVAQSEPTVMVGSVDHATAPGSLDSRSRMQSSSVTELSSSFASEEVA